MVEGCLLEIRISCPSPEIAARIGDALLEARLVAVAHTYPERAGRYRWQGAIVERAEVPLVVRTRADLFTDVVALASNHHPDQVPSITAVCIDLTTEAYRSWVWEQTRPDGRA